ncbi:hypothetical protein Y032_0002g722 [Ancylostoma ceylanicum]|uniref:Reverse transcriptase domain-containing protein n=1 Tax=Ancylostoma ceylanicum TaxID=53326 RepID=A0A016W149_9BILA|nr:hypothetical protein Y032_0002g722 [Ancylostoma ceylanicum]
MGVRVDGRLLHHLRFADDVVLITPSISQAERMLADFDDACGKIGLQLNLTKTMFMRNGWVPDASFSLNGTTISECSSYVHISGSGSQHDERPRSRTGQEEASGLGSIQEHRGRSEEDEEHQAPCPPLQHHGSPCFDLRFGNLGVMKAG